MQLPEKEQVTREALISGGIPLAVLFAGFASAQHPQPDGTPAPRPSALYNIEAFGVFRDLMLRGDFSPKVVMGSVMSRLPSPASEPFRVLAAKSPSPTES
jgi:hypothetical protein